MDEQEFPIIRPKRAPYHGPRPGPGQTAMLCPIERRYTVFQFTPDDRLVCLGCSFSIAREETV